MDWNKKYILELDGYELVNLMWLILQTQPSHCNGDWHCQIRWKIHQAVWGQFPVFDPTNSLEQELKNIAVSIGHPPNAHTEWWKEILEKKQ